MILLLLTAGCIEQGFTGLNDVWGPPGPAIEVAPEQLHYYEVSGGDSKEALFEIRSIGRSDLEVSRVAVVDDGLGDYTVLDTDTPFVLAPGESREVWVRFSPQLADERLAVVEVDSDDPELSTATVDLSGVGLLPKLEITPPSWDFGELGATCSSSVEMVLQNVGRADLTISSAGLSGDAGYAVTQDSPFLTTLPPLAYVTGTMTWTASTAGASSATLTVISDDPEGPRIATFTGQTSGLGATEDHFTAQEDPPVDILLLVDRSASMDDDAASLGDNFGRFITTLGEVTEGWRMGVVTLDSACFNEGILTPDTTSLKQTFAAAAITGTDAEISADEQMLYLGDKALRKTPSGECNENFLREGALLHIIVVSDEPDRSSERASAWTWDFFLERYLAYVPAPELLKVSGVIDTEGCNEGDDGYRQIIEATGGEAMSICSTDWADTMVTLAEASLTYAHSFTLSNKPMPSTLEVTVNGVVSKAWRYDAGLNAVVFENLNGEDAVVVAYEIAGAC